MTKEQRIAEFMTSKGYKFYDDQLGTRGFGRLGMPPVEVETAALWYQTVLEAQIALINKADDHADCIQRPSGFWLSATWFDAEKSRLEADLTQLLEEVK